MKKYTFQAFLPVLYITGIIILLINHSLTLAGANYGFTLWYTSLFPTLLPFMFISNFGIKSGLAETICQKLSYIANIFHIPSIWLFPIFIGLFCGYPLGACTCAELKQKHLLSQEEADVLTPICNNVSPAFMISYMAARTNFPNAIPYIMTAMYGGTLLSMMLILPKFAGKLYKYNPAVNPKPFSLLFSDMDSSVYTAALSSVKLCVYMMLFAIPVCYITAVKFIPYQIKSILLMLSEITSGIDMTSHSSMPLELKYIIITSLTAFGGICSIFQTISMTSGSGISIKKYIYYKCIISIITLTLSALIIYVFPLR